MSALIAAEKGLEMLPQALMAADVAGRMVKKYVPRVKKIANMAHHLKPRSLVRHIKKFRPKHIVKGVKAVSKFIGSGKALRGLQEVAGDVSQIADIAGKAGAISPETHGRISRGLSEGMDRATSAHQTLERYNERGRGIMQRHHRGDDF